MYKKKALYAPYRRSDVYLDRARHRRHGSFQVRDLLAVRRRDLDIAGHRSNPIHDHREWRCRVISNRDFNDNVLPGVDPANDVGRYHALWIVHHLLHLSR